MLIHRRQKTEQNHDESPQSMKRLPHSPICCFGRSKIRRFLATQYGFLVVLALIVIFFNEIFFYQWMKFNWPEIKHLTEKSSMQKLLLVADPQLIGEKDEGFFGLITRNDADRYLAKTFNQAKDYVEPDWILFLGDIFDEGLSANDDEFQRYFERFDSIFQYEKQEQKCIVIPGDNDVGGEYYGDKQPILRQRFRNYFGNTIALFKHKFIEYLKLDIDMFESYVNDKRFAIMEQTDNRPLSGPFRIILNHWPLLTRSARFVKPFINELEPNLILKGDSHHFNVFGLDRSNLTTYILARESLPESILSLDLQQKRLIYEITVPTCSYRMGVNRIGYGLLLLDTDTKTAHLTILSTPRRYISLYLYAAYGIFFILSLLFTSLFPRRSLWKFLMICK